METMTNELWTPVKSEVYHCAIEKLLETPSSSLTFTEKLQIISDGRPKEFLNLTTKLKSCVRHFSGKIYEEESWICGCEVLNKLFCWPCLLFSIEKCTWTNSGYVDLNNIYRSAKRHKDSASHIRCEKELLLFGKNKRIEFSLSEQYRLSIKNHNEMVKQNREIMGHLISVCCYLGKQGLTFRGHDESEFSINNGNYMELLNEISMRDNAFKTHLEKSAMFQGISPSIQNDLISSVSGVMIERIKQEVLEAPFVALILDESTDVIVKSQLVTIFRYVSKDGLVQERFLNFTDISHEKSADNILSHVLNIVNDFDCGAKLVSHTYDGAAVVAGEHCTLQEKICNLFPSAMFIHYYDHKLNLVLSQSASFIKPVKRFFINLAGFSSFFKSSARTHALDLIVKRRLPCVASTRWIFHSRIVETVYEHKADLELLFESMIDNGESEWDHETVVCARGLFSMLKDFEFIFLLNLFADIFPQSDILFQIIQKKMTDISLCEKKMKDFEEFIHDLSNKYESFWKRVDDFVHDKCTPVKRPRLDEMSGEDLKAQYERLFREILDVIGLNINQRFNENSKLQFMCLLESSKFTKFCESFPEEMLSCLSDNYGTHFEIDRLKNELTILYKDPDFKRKGVMELHQYMDSMQLSSIFPQTTKLCKLILTIPATSSSADRSFSCMKRIKDYLRKTQGQDRLSTLALMNIESALLDDLRSTPLFQDNVIDLFATKNTRIDFQFKY